MQLTSNYHSQKAPAFQSKFVKTKALYKAFDSTQRICIDKDSKVLNRDFLRAVKGLLNDGKKDVIKLVEKGKQFILEINGNEHKFPYSCGFYNFCNDYDGAKKAITYFAEDVRGIEPKSLYSLSEDEAKIAQGHIYNLTKRNPNEDGFLFKVGNLGNDIENSIFDSVKKELAELQKEIFKSKKY